MSSRNILALENLDINSHPTFYWWWIHGKCNYQQKTNINSLKLGVGLLLLGFPFYACCSQNKAVSKSLSCKSLVRFKIQKNLGIH